jgi:hypothetical protein
MFYNSNDSPDTAMDSIDHLLNDPNLERMSDQEYEELKNEFTELD